MSIVVRAITLSLLAATGSLAQTGTPAVPLPYRLADLTGDGLPDKLLLAPDGSLAVYVNRGHGEFDAIRQELPLAYVESVLVTDLDGDAHADLYLVSSGPNVALLDITDFQSGEQEAYMLYRFDASSTSQTIYGGKIYRDDIGVTPHGLGLLPNDFLVNDND
jgi:hypothetical protein